MGVVVTRYSVLVRPDLVQVFWVRMQAGDFISEAVELIDTSRRTGRRILVDSGGVRPYRGRDLKGRCLTFAEREEMWVSPETIYQSLYVQSRGVLKRDLTSCLRIGRAVRRPSRKVGLRKNRIPDRVNISQSPPEVKDRAVPVEAVACPSCPAILQQNGVPQGLAGS